MSGLGRCAAALLLSSLLAASVLLAGQQTASISGRVTEVGSGRPVAAATVELTPTDAPAIRTSTDQQGAFAFENLPPGTYFVKANKNGFLHDQRGLAGVSLDSRTRVDLHATTDRRTVSLELCRAASISGVLRDDNGDLLVGVRVRLLRRSPDGRTHVTEAVDATDDRGEYRFGGLAPEAYVVVVPSTLATFPPELENYGGTFGRRRVGDRLVRHLNELPVQVEEGQLPRVYPTTYLGGSRTLDSATVSRVQCGDVRSGADISLATVPAGAVSGVATVDGQPLGLAAVRLLPLDDSVASLIGLEPGMTVTSRDGRFRFEGIPFGTYEVRMLHYPGSDNPLLQMEVAAAALYESFDQQHTGRERKLRLPVSAPTLFAKAPVVVSEHVVNDVRLELSPVGRAGGQVEFNGASPSPSLETLRVFIELVRVDGPTHDITKPGWVTPQGTFSTYGSPPGRYLIQVVGDVPGWTAQSVMLGSKDVSMVPFDLGTTNLEDLKVVFTDQVASVAGTVRSRQAAAQATILLFPADASLWEYWAQLSNRFRAVSSSQTGAFEFSGLLPGDYFIVALPDADAVESLRSPRFGELAPFATKIRIAEGARLRQDLTLRGR